jgi:hypothetical protein
MHICRSLGICMELAQAFRLEKQNTWERNEFLINDQANNKSADWQTVQGKEEITISRESDTSSGTKFFSPVPNFSHQYQIVLTGTKFQKFSHWIPKFFLPRGKASSVPKNLDARWAYQQTAKRRREGKPQIRKSLWMVCCLIYRWYQSMGFWNSCRTVYFKIVVILMEWKRLTVEMNGRSLLMLQEMWYRWIM